VQSVWDFSWTEVALEHIVVEYFIYFLPSTVVSVLHAVTANIVGGLIR
jgi:hypothetical protein